MLFNLFSKKKLLPLQVDLHSHLIPKIDDGSGSYKESIEMINAFRNAGFKKLITTPHIHPKYPNSPQRILDGFSRLQERVEEEGIDIELEVAAEYYLDEQFLDRIEKNERFLSFGDRHLLIECSFISKPLFFEKAVFDLISKGYKPVFAHPERYQFLERDLSWLRELKRQGVLFQITLGSISGYYGDEVRRVGLRLLKEEMVDFLASDLHRISQFDYLIKGLEDKEVQKIIQNGRLLNNALL